jgi:hypothetical protein
LVEKDIKIDSLLKTIAQIENKDGEIHTRNEWKRSETTLETSGKDVKLHSKRVENSGNFEVGPANLSLLNELEILRRTSVEKDVELHQLREKVISSPLVSSVVFHLLNSFRV